MTASLLLLGQHYWRFSIEAGQSTPRTRQRTETRDAANERSWSLEIDSFRSDARHGRDTYSTTFGTRRARLRNRMGSGLSH
jgi:hypothetical protein